MAHKKDGRVMTEPGANFKRGTVEAGGFTLDYAEAGPANPKATIVSLPGSAGLEMSTAKDELARTYRVVEVNPPGWGGKSDVDREISQAELGAILAQAAAKLVAGKYYLIGTSMGGANALYAAKVAPDKILGIVLEGSMAPARLEDLHRPPPTAEQRQGMAMATEDAGFKYPTPPAHPNKPWATPDFVAGQMKNRFRMFRWVETEFSAGDAIDVVKTHNIPVLALLGEEDQILKTSQKDAYKAVLPHAQYQTIPGAEHDIQNSQPDAFVRSVDAFVRLTSGV